MTSDELRKPTSPRPKTGFLWPILLALTATGFCLRLLFVLRVNLHTDEYITMLAARMVLHKGLPILPSGLLYTHGLLFTYLDAALMALFGPSHTVARLPSLLLGTLSIPLIYAVGRRLFDSPAAGLLAATALTFAPNAIIWGGRARMYALLQVFILLMVYCGYKGVIEGDRPLYRYGFWLVAFGALLTHFVASILLPPFVLALVVVGWLTRARLKNARSEPRSAAECRPIFGHWFIDHWSLRSRVIAEGLLALTLIYTAFFVKRLEQPAGLPAYGAAPSSRGLLEPIVAQLHSRLQPTFSWQSSVQPFREYFLSSNREQWFWLTALGVALFVGLAVARRVQRRDLSFLYGLIVVGGTVLELATLFKGEFRGPRYNFAFLPIYFLIAGWGLPRLLSLVVRHGTKWSAAPWLGQAATVVAVIALATVSWPAAQPPLKRQERGYDAAFGYVGQHWQAGDAIMTTNPVASFTLLGRCDYYVVQGGDEDSFTIETERGRVDRWIGAPVVDSVDTLNAALAAHPRVWMVANYVNVRVTFERFFNQQLLAQMDQVYSNTGAHVLMSKPNPRPIRFDPPHSLRANLGHQVLLVGYDAEPETVAAGQTVRLTLYWQPLVRLPHDYTVFVHLRDAANQTVAQNDHRPLGDLFPTHDWPADGDVVRETSELPIPAGTPPGRYRLLAGMYRLETLKRLPVIDDASGENAVVLGDITVTD